MRLSGRGVAGTRPPDIRGAGVRARGMSAEGDADDPLRRNTTAKTSTRLTPTTIPSLASFVILGPPTGMATFLRVLPWRGDLSYATILRVWSRCRQFRDGARRFRPATPARPGSAEPPRQSAQTGPSRRRIKGEKSEKVWRIAALNGTSTIRGSPCAQ